ncbi:MAG: DUF2335 domain-containing protein [Janthinobacterium lividum]
MPDEAQHSPEAIEPVQRDQASVATLTTVATSWRGPLPPPDALRAYEEAVPGCAERIIAMAEADMQHLHSEERAETEHRRMAIQSEIESERRGMWLAFILAVFFIGLSGFLLYAGHLGWGVGLLSADLITLASLFVYGRNVHSAELTDVQRLEDVQ